MDAPRPRRFLFVFRGQGAMRRPPTPRQELEHFSLMWLRHARFFRSEDHLTLRGALRALGLEGDTLEAAGLAGGQSD